MPLVELDNALDNAPQTPQTPQPPPASIRRRPPHPLQQALHLPPMLPLARLALPPLNAVRNVAAGRVARRHDPVLHACRGSCQLPRSSSSLLDPLPEHLSSTWGGDVPCAMCRWMMG